MGMYDISLLSIRQVDDVGFLVTPKSEVQYNFVWEPWIPMHGFMADHQIDVQTFQ